MPRRCSLCTACWTAATVCKAAFSTCCKPVQMEMLGAAAAAQRAAVVQDVSSYSFATTTFRGHLQPTTQCNADVKCLLGWL
jgi:hypothetical protein